MPFYLSTIWTMRRAFFRFSDGGSFDLVFPPSLSKLGAALVGVGIASVFVAPGLMRLLGGAHAAFDTPAITIGVVGLLLMVLSGLFARAVEVRRELDDIFLMPIRVTLDAVLARRRITREQLARVVGPSETQLSLF